MSKRIFVYGTGVNAVKYLQEVKRDPQIKVMGILDRYHLSGQMEGVPIVSWEDIQPGSGERIVIAANPKYYKEIYVRILPYAVANGLEIYTTCNQNLTAYFGFQVRTRGMVDSMSEGTIRGMIQDAEVISFDIFDTLLMRKVVNPVDIFKLVEIKARRIGINLKNFYKVRREAELAVNGRDIHSIYKEIKSISGLSECEKNTLLNLEIETESEIIMPRQYVKKMFDECVAEGKTIVLSSDMYLTTGLLEKLLTNKGIIGYKWLYVSCEQGMSKVGGLLQRVRDNFPGCKIVHVGDDWDADIKAAAAAGMNPIYIPKAYDLALTTPLGSCVGHIKNISDSIMVGEIICKLFDNPFTGDLSVEHLETFVKLCLLPIVVQYMYLLNKCICEKQYEAVLFIARDGYFFKNCYDVLRETGIMHGPDSKYILCSRKLAIRTGMQDEKDIREIMDIYGIDEYDMRTEGIFGVLWKPEMDVQTLYTEVLEHSRKTREGYLKYLEEMDVALDKAYLYCELDGQGTGYYWLNQLFEQNMDSLYLIRQHVRERYDRIPMPAAYIHLESGGYSSFLEHVAILEMIFTSLGRSALDADSEGKIVFAKESRTESQIKLVERIQDILMEQTKSFFDIIPIENAMMSPFMVERLFEISSEIRLSGECEELAEASLFDEVIEVSLPAFT